MKCNIAMAMIFCLSLSSVATAQGFGELVRIPTPISPRCINAKTDEITITMRRFIIHKDRDFLFLTEDKKAGITVLTTLNSDGHPPSQTPSVNLVSIEEEENGQVSIPLEYPIASVLSLSLDSGKTYTKNMLLELYLDKPRGKATFGEILDSAGVVLGKLPIPPNPYTAGANIILQWANTAISNASKDKGGQRLASITLQFNNRDEPDLEKCRFDGNFITGALAIISPKGADESGPPLTLGNLEQRYCWRYSATNTYEVQYASKPSTGCKGITDDTFKEVPNDYVMFLVAAAKTEPLRLGLQEKGNKGPSPERKLHLHESAKLCQAMRLSPSYCGIN